MHKKITLCLCLLLVYSLVLAGCGFSTAPLSRAGFSTERITVELEGITGTYNLLLLADLHIIADTAEVSPGELENVKARRDSLFMNSVKLWDKLPSAIDKCGADYLLLAGDMIDFNSEANIKALGEGLASLKTPFVYIRGDHDAKPYFMSDGDDSRATARQNSIYQNEAAYYIEFEEFVILALNNSTEQIPSAGVTVAKEACGLGKPVILLTHVPLDSWTDGSIRDTSAAAKGGRFLIWSSTGECDYYPDASTGEFLSLIYTENSPVKEVLCGHLHLNWDGYITPNTHQHVFSPAFSKYVGVIEIKGK